MYTEVFLFLFLPENVLDSTGVVFIIYYVFIYKRLLENLHLYFPICQYQLKLHLTVEVFIAIIKILDKIVSYVRKKGLKINMRAAKMRRIGTKIWEI